MSDQLDLNFTGTARRRNRMLHYRPTSREAHRTRSARSQILDNLIIEEIRKAGPDGITCQQIEINLGRKHESVSGNLSHLVNDQDPAPLVDSGKRGKVLSGRSAILWILAGWIA